MARYQLFGQRRSFFGSYIERLVRVDTDIEIDIQRDGQTDMLIIYVCTYISLGLGVFLMGVTNLIYPVQVIEIGIINLAFAKLSVVSFLLQQCC